MSLRVISGQYRRRLLRTPSDDSTRPYTDRVRQMVFDRLNHLIPNARVADVLLGADPIPAPKSPRLLWPTDVWALLEAPAAEAARTAAEQVQAVLGRAAPVTLARDSFEAMYWHFRHIQGREAWMTDGPMIERYAPPLGPGVAERAIRRRPA